MSGLLTALGIGLPFVDTLFNFLNQQQLNARQEGFINDALKILSTQTGPATDPGALNFLAGTPNVSLNDFTSNFSGSQGNGTINLNDIIGSPDSSLAAFNESFKPTDFGGVSRDALSQVDRGRTSLNAAMRSPLGDSSTVGGFFPGDEQFAKTENRLLGQSEDSSFGRQAATNQRLGSAALARGGLQGVNSVSQNVRDAEARQRSSEARDIGGAIEGLRVKNAQIRGTAQANAFGNAAGINARLASVLGSLGGAGGQLLLEAAKAGASQNEFGAANRANLTNTDNQSRLQFGAAQLASLLDLLNFGTAGPKQALANDFANALAAAQIQANVPQVAFPSNAGAQAANNAVQFSAISASGPKSSFQASGSIAGTGGGFGSGCVDGQATVKTPDGDRMLGVVESGDYVMAADGKYRKVVAKDYGWAPESDRDNHIRITLSNGRSLTITGDHKIKGVRADKWRPRMTMRALGQVHEVQSIEKSDYVVSGDIMLEGNVPYIVNGCFPVNSWIGQMGIEKWNKMMKDLDEYKRIHGDVIICKEQELIHA